jgi:hypothetical protein
MKFSMLKSMCTSMVIGALFIKANTRNQPMYLSVEKKIKKCDMYITFSTIRKMKS